ncbi:uncharacterized protein [Ptychodera flava]|uniref:uncharacterized protein n=1 Tax=Ptychodera flava TaxID=63121 RepID=UPI003969FA23
MKHAAIFRGKKIHITYYKTSTHQNNLVNYAFHVVRQSKMLTSVVSSQRRSSWNTSLPPSIGPFNGKNNNNGKQKTPSRRGSQKKGYWSRSTDKEPDDRKGTDDDTPRIRCVYIGDRYKETQTETDYSEDEHRPEQS